MLYLEDAMNWVKPRIKLSHHVIVDDQGDVCIGEIPGAGWIVRRPPEWFVKLLPLLDGTRTLPRLLKELPVDKSKLEGILRKMHDARLLEDAAEESSTLTSEEKELYNRQMLHFSLVEREGKSGLHYQERLKAQHVVVLGLGGWGTWTTLNLALAGFGRLTLVDGDTVELSNLNRQVLYRHEDIGLPKVEAAKKNLRSINPNVDVKAIHEFVTRDEAQVRRLLEGATQVVLAWANMAYFRKNTVEEIVHRVAQEMGIPVLELGGDPLAVSVGPFFPNDGKSPCFECLRKDVRSKWYSRDEAIRSFQRARFRESFLNGRRRIDAWQSAPSLSMIAGLAADQLVKWATGCDRTALVGRRFQLSLQTFESKTEEFARDEQCPRCRKN